MCRAVKGDTWATAVPPARHILQVPEQRHHLSPDIPTPATLTMLHSLLQLVNDLVGQAAGQFAALLQVERLDHAVLNHRGEAARERERRKCRNESAEEAGESECMLASWGRSSACSWDMSLKSCFTSAKLIPAPLPLRTALPSSSAPKGSPAKQGPCPWLYSFVTHRLQRTPPSRSVRSISKPSALVSSALVSASMRTCRQGLGASKGESVAG